MVIAENMKMTTLMLHGNLLVGVLAENVLDDHNGLLHHIINLGLDEV